MDYKYLCIDANYYLRRNWCVVKNAPYFNEDMLISSFLQSVIKIYKSYPADKIIFLWDKSPYIKSNIIKEYKQNRRMVLIEEENLKEQVKNATDENERQKLQKELDKVAIEAEQFRKFSNTKYEIIANLRNFGFSSIIIPGLEADDLGHYISKLAKEHGDKTLLVSSDSDWMCLCNEYTDVYQYKTKNPHLFKYDEVKNIFAPYSDLIPIFEYYQIKDIYDGGHNNVILSSNFKNFSKIEIINKINNKDIDDIKDFYEYYEALSMNKFYDEFKNTISKMLDTEGLLDIDGWRKYHDQHKLKIYVDYVANYLGMLDKNLYLK